MIHETTFKTYATGFLSSLFLTALAFILVAHHAGLGQSFLSNNLITYGLLGLAVLQFIMQLIFFIHLGLGSKQRFNLAIFMLTLSVVLIIVIGSIWIMNNLNYNMTPQQMDQYNINEG
jgi:cytochrome o ubiquinol oxidase operon protein cyoD